MRPQPEVRHALRGDARLVNVTGTELELRADAECVVLPTPHAESLELDIHREIAVTAVVPH